jgi:hypothetical protein
MPSIKLPAFFTLLSLGAGACAADDTPELGEADQELILGGEDWDQLPNFESDPTYYRGSLYGRATANLDMGSGGRCSGWMITDNILVTAHHCRNGHTTITAKFGQYDASPGGNAAGLADARNRLAELGVPLAVSATIGDSTLTHFSCSLYESEYPSTSRDVDFYLCAPNQVTMNIPPFNRNRTFEFHPGHLWGQYELDLGSRSDGDYIYAISTNKTNAQDSAGLPNSVLLSPHGYVYDGDDDFYGQYAHNFEFVGSDIICGSSGGVMMDQTDHRAFGLITGQYSLSGDDSCDRTGHGNGGTFYSNVGTYLGDGAATLVGYGASYDGVPKVGTHNSAWVGGTGGTLRTMTCPTNFVATGVIGTRINGVIGNFGVVCTPYRRGYFETTGADATVGRDFKNSTVLAGGSIDTDFVVANGTDYNTYWHDVVPNHDGSTPQSQIQCPFGSYLSGVNVSRVNALISGVDSIRCTELKKVGNSVEQRASTFSTPGLSGATASKQTALCKDNSYATGLIERSGYFTDGFQLACTQLYPIISLPPNPN